MSSDKKNTKTLDEVLEALREAEKEYQSKLDKYADFLAECERAFL